MASWLLIFNKILGVGTLIGLIASLWFLWLIINRQSNNFLKKNRLLLLFLASSAAMAGSLIYSDWALFEPCRLCWYQRIALFPQVLIFAIALRRNDQNILPYSFFLSVVGALIAIYHYYLQFFTQAASGACGTNGVSCVVSQFREFGFITIPLMSLTIFLLLITLTFAGRNWTKKDTD